MLKNYHCLMAMRVEHIDKFAALCHNGNVQIRLKNPPYKENKTNIKLDISSIMKKIRLQEISLH